MITLPFGLRLQPEQLLPTFLIVLYIGSAVGYFMVGKYPRAMYFAAAAVLNITVTYYTL